MAKGDWESRLRDAAYTAPSGTRVAFQYEDVSRATPLRTQAFSFPGVDGDYHQQNGFGSRRYPLRCIFWGQWHDLEAKAFEGLLLERGRGKLEHPMYGTFMVVPTGEFTRRDDLKTAANQSIVEVEFSTSLAAIYPSASADPENEILAGLDLAGLALCEQFSSCTDLTSAVAKAASRGTIRGFLDSVSTTIGSLSDLVASVRADFQDAVDTINYGMDVLIGEPLLLAQQIGDLIAAPSRALDGLKSRLDMYDALVDKIFGSDAAKPSEAISSVSPAVAGRFALSERGLRIANDFHTSDLFASNAVSGATRSALAASNAEARGPRTRRFRTRPETLRSADSLGSLLDLHTAWRDAGFSALGAISKTGPYQQDPGEAAALLRNAVTMARGHLVEISFSQVPERAVVLDRPRTIIDLAGELYGHVDPRDGFDPLDFMVEANDLNGDEILELPRGRRVVYYDYAA